ncbi:MAG: hypothetical protein Q9200_002910 [Gallowayella weberi]
MDLLSDIQSHLVEVTLDPAGKALNAGLLEKFDGQVTGVQPAMPIFTQRSSQLSEVVLLTLAQLLPNLQQDPSPATALIETLIRPASYTFTRVLDIQPPVDFVAGLKALFPSINHVTLSLLEKAGFKSSDAGIVAGKPEVVAALIELWLSTPTTAVALKAHQVLLALLTVGEEGRKLNTVPSTDHPEFYGQSLMWRRVFRDKDVYGSIYRICSLSTAGRDGQLSKRDKTVAQGRLLDLLVKIDCDSIRHQQLAEVESHYGVKNGGLMEFAALNMVDHENDVLMHMTLVDFLAEILKPDHSIIQTFSMSNHTSSSLAFLIQTGLHARTLSYYLDASEHSSLDLTYLYSRSANYLANYCSSHPHHFLSDRSVSNRTIDRLYDSLKDMTSGR